VDFPAVRQDPLLFIALVGDELLVSERAARFGATPAEGVGMSMGRGPGMGAKRDTRRIQTAVLGHQESDEPLVLPLEAFELDVFRHLYREATFWCGVLLGGCGGRLTTKLYTTGPVPCQVQHVELGCWVSRSLRQPRRLGFGTARPGAVGGGAGEVEQVLGLGFVHVQGAGE
jgi:hypothetical protein